jgi:hypothetical protein
MEGLQTVQPRGDASAWDEYGGNTAIDASWGTGYHHLPKRRRSAILGSHGAGVFRRHMQQSLVWPWWAHPMARELPGLDASRLFRHLRADKDHRTKLNYDRRSPRPVHTSLRKCCAPRPPWRTCWGLMCWDTKVVSLLHVYIPLTGENVDYFLQRSRFFLWHHKRITLYFKTQAAGTSKLQRRTFTSTLQRRTDGWFVNKEFKIVCNILA